MIRWIVAALLLSTAAHANDPVRLVDTQGGVFADYALYVAEQEGYYAAEKLDATVTVGRGGSTSVQVVITGSADIVYGPGTFSVIAAFAKGAPLTIIGNAIRGAGDTFWYVRKDSPIKSLKDIDGDRTLAYSSPGSLTSLLVETMIRENKIHPKLVAVGSFASARTQMMSGQIDTAFSSFPSNMDLIRKGEARIVATGDDAASLRPSSMRVIAANSDWLAKHRDVAVRAMRAIWKAQHYAFSNPKALTDFAEKWQVDPEDAKQAWNYFKLDQLTLAPVSEFDLLLKLAQDQGFIKEPLTAEQKKKLIDIVYDPDKK